MLLSGIGFTAESSSNGIQATQRLAHLEQRIEDPHVGSSFSRLAINDARKHTGTYAVRFPA
jgi:hypothetical protein